MRVPAVLFLPISNPWEGVMPIFSSMFGAIQAKERQFHIDGYQNSSDNYEVKVAIKNNHFSHGMNFDRSDRIEIKNNQLGRSIFSLIETQSKF